MLISAIIVEDRKSGTTIEQPAAVLWKKMYMHAPNTSPSAKLLLFETLQCYYKFQYTVST